jgi:DNA primase
LAIIISSWRQIMNLLELIKDKPGFKKQNNKTWEGPCPKCGGNDRFIVWLETNIFKCRSCDFKGDLISYLREVEDYSCREAFIAVGRDCGRSECSYYEKCKGITAPRKRKSKTVAPLAQPPQGDWQPREAESPAETWRRKAAGFVLWAHEQLLLDQSMLDYLAGRGLPLDAVKRYRLGWNPGEIRHGEPGPLFKKRKAWGLDNKINDGGKEVTVLAIQRGIIIPSFAGEAIYRIRIRRPDQDLQAPVPDGKKKPAKYLFLEGSGKGLVIRNPRSKAFVIVESDLDDLLIDYLAGDIICSVPLTSCGIRPDADSAPIFEQAVCILNALDYETRPNRQTGNLESPGGQNAIWWQKHFPVSERWPPPLGKDPGEAWQQGVDLRRWIIDGLPISLQPRQSAEEKKVEVPKVAIETEGFNAVRVQQLIRDSRSRIESSWQNDGWEWLGKNRPDIIAYIKGMENTVDERFGTEDELGVLAALDTLERWYQRAWEVYAERPPVIERQNDLFNS